MEASTTKQDRRSRWIATPVSNLVRYEASGVYFARLRVSGKLIWKSLRTDRISIAKLRLADFVKERRTEADQQLATTSGRMTFGAALQIYRERLQGNARLKPRAKIYREKCIECLLKTWPGLEALNVRQIRKDDCLQWAASFAKKYSPSVYNNTVGTLRHVLAVAMENGALYSNPAETVPKRRPSVKKLQLPSQEQFTAFISSIEDAGAWCSKECSQLVRFLAYGGFRKQEAANITWADCDFRKGSIRVYGDPETRTKNGEFRTVPMIQPMRDLLKGLRAERPDEPESSPVMKVGECQKAMDRAAARAGMARITHHDLRHLFATRCIEAGVDVPTVSRWLGHKDGGALAMRVYGHLRDEHSTTMAAKVTF